MKRIKKGRDKDFRCTICGRYISYQDINNNNIEYEFIPDTEFTTERHMMCHKLCINKIKP